MSDWIKPSVQLPKNGEIVNTMNSHGQVTKLKRSGRLWFVPDGSMYVYYEPTFWQPVPRQNNATDVQRAAQGEE